LKILDDLSCHLSVFKNDNNNNKPLFINYHKNYNLLFTYVQILKYWDEIFHVHKEQYFVEISSPKTENEFLWTIMNVWNSYSIYMLPNVKLCENPKSLERLLDEY